MKSHNTTTILSKPIITGLILTYNGEQLIEKCINSLQFCDHIIIVDSFSSDQTAHIAQKYNVQFIQHSWKGPVYQFQYALQQITTEWVITLDQDEICSKQLKYSIQNALNSVSLKTCGFYVSRQSWYYDRFLKHSGWYPDYLLRVFRKNEVYFSQQGAHEKIHPHGLTKKLQGNIFHYPYKNFYHQLEKINTYAQQGSYTFEKKEKTGGLCKALLHGLGAFIKMYIIKQGFLDGKAGLINAIHGFFYAFTKYIRVNEGTWGFPYDHQ